jgi:hypothetical protein
VTTPGDHSRSLTKRLLPGLVPGLVIACLSVLLAATAIEVYCRINPPAGVYYGGSVPDQAIGVRYRPSSTIVYTKAGERVDSLVNRDGFLDADHAGGRPPGTVRVGFFGDSYVEALQVPLEQRFFRRLPDRVRAVPFEYFGFGMSGFGTVHSYLNARVWGRTYDLDAIVYVFVENDPGDNIARINKNPRRPFAVLTQEAPGFTIDRSFEERNRLLDTFPYNVLRNVKNRSFALQIVQHRLSLLPSSGASAAQAPRTAAASAPPPASDPNENDLPEAWNESDRTYAGRLGRAILAEWAREARKQGRRFSVLYMPRGSEFLSDKAAGKTWKPWLLETCRALNIHVIDPSEAFLKRERSGVPVYVDHLTAQGHEALGEVLQGWLETIAADQSRSM